MPGDRPPGFSAAVGPAARAGSAGPLPVGSLRSMIAQRYLLPTCAAPQMAVLDNVTSSGRRGTAPCRNDAARRRRELCPWRGIHHLQRVPHAVIFFRDSPDAGPYLADILKRAAMWYATWHSSAPPGSSRHVTVPLKRASGSLASLRPTRFPPIFSFACGRRCASAQRTEARRETAHRVTSHRPHERAHHRAVLDDHHPGGQ